MLLNQSKGLGGYKSFMLLHRSTGGLNFDTKAHQPYIIKTRKGLQGLKQRLNINFYLYIIMHSVFIPNGYA